MLPYLRRESSGYLPIILFHKRKYVLTKSKQTANLVKKKSGYVNSGLGVSSDEQGIAVSVKKHQEYQHSECLARAPKRLIKRPECQEFQLT